MRGGRSWPRSGACHPTALASDSSLGLCDPPRGKARCTELGSARRRRRGEGALGLLLSTAASLSLPPALAQPPDSREAPSPRCLRLGLAARPGSRRKGRRHRAPSPRSPTGAQTHSFTVSVREFAPAQLHLGNYRQDSPATRIPLRVVLHNLLLPGP